MTKERRYTLVAVQRYDMHVYSSHLSDTLSNLYLILSRHRYAVLHDDAGQYILTRPSEWGWERKPDLQRMQLGRSQLEPDTKQFRTLDQALTYLDVCT